MDLYVFDRDLNFLGIIDTFHSFRWVRRYHKCGEFELNCVLDDNTSGLLKQGNVIWKQDDLEAACVEYIKIDRNTDGVDTLNVKGRFLTSYLSRRILWGTVYFKNSARTERVMREVVSQSCINGLTKRAIPNLKLGELKNFSHTSKCQISDKNVLEVVEGLSSVSQLGYRTMFDIQNKELIFDVYEGRDFTTNQTTNPPAVFSHEFDNVLEQEYVDSSFDYRNVAKVAGEGEGADRAVIEHGESRLGGLDRYETFVDARDLQFTDSEDFGTWDQYLDALRDRGDLKLAENRKLETFEVRINPYSNLQYKKDFDLGDMVTCISKKWGVVTHSRITEIEEIYEQDRYDINAVFGNSIPTLIDKIKQVVK